MTVIRWLKTYYKNKMAKNKRIKCERKIIKRKEKAVESEKRNQVWRKEGKRTIRNNNKNK